MGYHVAGSNLSNAEQPSVGFRVETAAEAMELVSELQRDGYSVRIATTDGDEVSVNRLQDAAAVDG